TSVVAEPDLSTLPSAPAASDPESLAALDLPSGVPEELVALAEDVAGPGSAYSRAVALTSYLSAPSDDGFTLVVDEPPSGHTVGHITCFLLLEDRCGRSGSTEQFVASFAVLARAAGLPTRVVVGFRAPNVAPGETGEVTGALATAWA